MASIISDRVFLSIHPLSSQITLHCVAVCLLTRFVFFTSISMFIYSLLVARWLAGWHNTASSHRESCVRKMFSLFYENKHFSLARSSFHIKQAKLTVNHRNDGPSTRVVAAAALIASWKPNSPLQLGRIAFESTARCRSRYFTSGECKSSAICTTRSAAQRVQGCETLNFARRLFLDARHTAVGDILIGG